MENLYTYDEAAKALGLKGRSSIRSRIVALEKQGKPLTVKAGDFLEVGSSRFITETGLTRLREYEPGKAGRPPQNLSTPVHGLV